MQAHGTDATALRPLSGGMVFLGLWLTQRVYSLNELDEPFRQFMENSRRIGTRASPYSAKATKYACQCLEALGMAKARGGDEYHITPLWNELLNSDKLRDRFPNVYKLFEQLRTTR